MAEKKKTIAELTVLANAGDRDAMAELGDRYYYGEGVRRDRAKSTEWYQKALMSIEGSGGFYSRQEYSFERSTARAASSAIKYAGHALIAAATTMILVWVAHNIGYLFLLFLFVITCGMYLLLAGGKQ